jgi:hypothetical protein
LRLAKRHDEQSFTTLPDSDRSFLLKYVDFHFRRIVSGRAEYGRHPRASVAGGTVYRPIWTVAGVSDEVKTMGHVLAIFAHNNDIWSFRPVNMKGSCHGNSG